MKEYVEYRLHPWVHNDRMRVYRCADCDVEITYGRLLNSGLADRYKSTARALNLLAAIA